MALDKKKANEEAENQEEELEDEELDGDEDEGDEEGGDEGETEDDGDDEEADDEAASAEDDEDEGTHKKHGETSEQKRKRRAEERKNKRIMQRLAKVRDKLKIKKQDEEIAMLKKGVANLTTGQVQSNMRELDTKIQGLKNNLSWYKNARITAKNAANAVEEDRLTDLIETTRKELDAHEKWKEKFATVTATKGSIPTTEEAANHSGMQAPPSSQADNIHSNPIVKQKVTDWAIRVGYAKWSDAEQGLAKAIDEEVLNDGFDPTTDGYYREISKRLRTEIPERFSQNRTNAPTPKRDVPHVGGGSRNASSGGGSTNAAKDPGKGIPESIKRYWKDNGLWADSKQRQRMADSYWAEAEKGGMKRPR